jgi:hypothetical protein
VFYSFSAFDSISVLKEKFPKNSFHEYRGMSWVQHLSRLIACDDFCEEMTLSANKRAVISV